MNARSGDAMGSDALCSGHCRMVWVKKVFGVVLLGVALFYGALAFAPTLLWLTRPNTGVTGFLSPKPCLEGAGL